MILYKIEDYRKFTNTGMLLLAEEETEYKLNVQDETHQYKDKIFKEILSDKKEFIKFIEKYLGNEEFGTLQEEDIEKYNKEFITKSFNKREADNIYKVLNDNVFIILEHQSKIDYKMPERMLEYCTEFIRELDKNSNQITRPLICPVVLYTGRKKWNVEKTIKERVKRNYGFKSLNYPEYNLIDINDYSNEELIAENTGISKALLFEKISNKQELKDILEAISKKKINKIEEKTIIKILTYSNKIRKMLPKDKIEDVKNNIEKGGRENMRFEKFFIELMKDEEKRGKLEMLKQIIKEMLNQQMSDEQIMKITKIDKEELEKFKIA